MYSTLTLGHTEAEIKSAIVSQNVYTTICRLGKDNEMHFTVSHSIMSGLRHIDDIILNLV